MRTFKIDAANIQGSASDIKKLVDLGETYGEVLKAAQTLALHAHGCAFANGWWHDPKTGELIERNNGEIFMLVVSEIAEAMEADRKNKMDDHLPHRKGVEVELADAVIRIFDFAGRNSLDIGGAIFEKLRYNNQRAGHKPENRLKDDGKKY